MRRETPGRKWDRIEQLPEATEERSLRKKKKDAKEAVDRYEKTTKRVAINEVVSTKVPVDFAQCKML